MTNTMTDGPSPADPKPAQPLVLTITIDPGSLADLMQRAFGPAVADATSGTRPSAPPPPPRANPPAGASGGTEIKPGDPPAAGLSAAILSGKITEGTGLLVDIGTLAQLLGVSSRTVSRLFHRGSIPSPVQLGRGRKWRLAEILEWIEAGCPSQKTWAQMGRSPKRQGR